MVDTQFNQTGLSNRTCSSSARLVRFETQIEDGKDLSVLEPNMKSVQRLIAETIGHCNDDGSDAIRQNENIRSGPGVQWVPLIRLLSMIEQGGIPFWGTPRQPFDPRELVWTSALGKGVQAVAKLITNLDVNSVNKSWFKSSESAVPTSASNVSYFGSYPRSIYQELAVLAHASIGNINTVIKLLGVDRNYSCNYFSIVIEFAEFHTLREYLVLKKGIEEAQAKLFCSEIAAALEYLHSEEILHNDVKMENILVTRGGAKLSDFGHAIFNFKKQTKDRLNRERSLVGTRRWTAPELYDLHILQEPSLHFSATSDIYSFGFVIAFLAAGFDFFSDIGDDTLNEWKCNDKVLNELPSDIMRESEWASRLLPKTLRLQPSERFQSALEILSDAAYRPLQSLLVNEQVRVYQEGLHT